MKYKFIFFALLLACSLLMSQVNTYSPYSYFGVGTLSSVGNSNSISMGGLGASIMSEKSLNYINPASYSFLDRTVLEFGMRSTFLKMSELDNDQNNFTSGLSSLSLGFPISKNISLSSALLPYSSVGYTISQTENLDSLNTSTTSHTGAGGINRFLIGASWQILDNLSIGGNFNYLFGPIRKETFIHSNQSPYYFRNISDKMTRGFNFDLGLIYTFALSDYQIVFGTTFKPGSSLKAEGYSTQYLSTDVLNENSDYLISSDTLYNNSTINLPLEASIGFSIQSNTKWLIGLEYKNVNWPDYNESEIDVCCMHSSNEFIIGGFFTPNKDDIYNYFNRVQYRLGLSYSKGYLDLTDLYNENSSETNPLTHFSGSFGMVLPINKVSSTANISARYGFINNGFSDDYIKERYFSIYLAMTLNEKWFNKIKIK